MDPLSVLPEAFRTKVSVESSGCWVWIAGRVRGGYGAFYDEGRQVRAHRFSYERLVGPIPEGLVLDHLCSNPSCVRPDHLEPVTQRVNVLRSSTTWATRNSTKTHCANGHEFTPENTLDRGGSGWRGCRECGRNRCRVSYARYIEKRRAWAREYQRRKRGAA